MAGNLFQVSNQFNLEAARVGFHAAFMQQLQMMEDDPIGNLYATLSSTGSAELINWLGDMPGMEEWKGDRNLADMSALSLLVVNKDWSSGFRAHQNNFKDDKLGLFPMSVSMLAENAQEPSLRSDRPGAPERVHRGGVPRGRKWPGLRRRVLLLESRTLQ